MQQKPVLALVGRPNVGKSTLFNRLVGTRQAIVENTPGTTRDRHYADVEWENRVFTVIDTGGLVLGETDDMTEQIRIQAQIAMQEADAICFLTDVLDGVTPADYQVADLLRRTSKPVLLVVNKVDSARRHAGLVDFYSLGMGDPLPVSAERGLSTGDLLDAIVAVLPEMPPEEDDSEAIHVALVGRTNVGKSSLLNRLLGEERVVVSDIPGTTRDTIDTRLTYEGQELVLIDTAGIRRRGRIEQGIEKYSVLRSMRAIARADVTLLVIDASEGITAQDAHVAGYILEERKSVILVVNKWDLVEKDTYTLPTFQEKVLQQLKFMPWVPVAFVSALTGQRVQRLMPLVTRVYAERHARIRTSELNQVVRDAVARSSPPTTAGKKLRFYYATQSSGDPPNFVFFVNDPALVHFGYRRYLENRIREKYPFEGTPIELTFRGREDRE
ncbi:MAG: ribosome biogenesis GTPase Der [Chloroflexi bacterium]|jgi:GTP-binding protein|nr:ribosome biogenesis GTPase Der [Chloroflexota bacterium]